MPTDIVLRSVSTIEPARAPPRVTVPDMAMPDMPAALAPATPNPRLRLDGSLGMVVLEFRGTGGDVANTIPSPRAIAAYRAAAMTDAPMPVGVTPRAETSPAAPPPEAAAG